MKKRKKKENRAKQEYNRILYDSFAKKSSQNNILMWQPNLKKKETMERSMSSNGVFWDKKAQIRSMSKMQKPLY